jgi:hypothetical protein
MRVRDMTPANPRSTHSTADAIESGCLPCRTAPVRRTHFHDTSLTRRKSCCPATYGRALMATQGLSRTP